MDIKERVELTMDEASKFSAVGTLRKNFDCLTRRSFSREGCLSWTLEGRGGEH